MSILIITFVAMTLFITVMAVGVIFGREPLKGSCGGLNKIGIDGKCEICGMDPKSCDSDEQGGMKLLEHKPDPALGYDAMKSTKKPS